MELLMLKLLRKTKIILVLGERAQNFPLRQM